MHTLFSLSCTGSCVTPPSPDPMPHHLQDRACMPVAQLPAFLAGDEAACVPAAPETSPPLPPADSATAEDLMKTQSHPESEAAAVSGLTELSGVQIARVGTAGEMAAAGPGTRVAAGAKCKGAGMALLREAQRHLCSLKQVRETSCEWLLFLFLSMSMSLILWAAPQARLVVSEQSHKLIWLSFLFCVCMIAQLILKG